MRRFPSVLGLVGLFAASANACSAAPPPTTTEPTATPSVVPSPGAEPSAAPPASATAPEPIMSSDAGPPVAPPARRAFVQCSPEAKQPGMCTREYRPVCVGLEGGGQKEAGNACDGCKLKGAVGYFEVACADVGKDTTGAHIHQPASGTPVACKDEDRKRPGCHKMLAPVCAFVDTGVRCVKAPCPSAARKEYGNACLACLDANVTSYVEWGCP